MTERLEKARSIGRYLTAAAIALLLLYYCIHPALYEGKQRVFLLASRKTYLVMAVTMALTALALTPVRLEEDRNRRFSWCWFGLAPFAVYFSLLYLNAAKYHIKFFALNGIALFLTFVFLYLLETAILLLTGSLRFAAAGMAVLIAALGIANRFVISFRGMALSAADLFSVGAAASVAGEYTYELDWYMYMEVLLTFAICLVSLKLHGGTMLSPALRLALLVLWGAVTGSYYYVCCRTDFLERHDIRSEGFTHQLRYKKYDMLFTTLTTCFYLSVDKPEGYSAEKVREIAEAYAGEDAEKVQEIAEAYAGEDAKKVQEIAEAYAGEDAKEKPNIIVIMNESFADYTDIGRGLTLSADCMPFLHSLTENTIRGNAYVSIFGGNTPNSEYEFLTGNTMAFLPESSVGFHLFVREGLPSVASLMKENGYETLAIHPYRGTNYRRHLVYPQLGFDRYLTRKDFYRPWYVRNYISDQTLAGRIISEYEDNKSTGKPLFSYNVTIQNHGDYFAANTRNLELAIEPSGPEANLTKARIYLNLIRESDRALEQLVAYFEKEKEPVILIMFGDHQANLGEEVYEYLIGAEESLTPEERMEQYKVPFVAWANYDIPEETIEKTSLNYLYSLLADRLNLPMTGYQRYLLDLNREIPAISAQGYWGADGQFYEVGDTGSPYYETLREYQILQYNDILGKEERYLPFFAGEG